MMNTDIRTRLSSLAAFCGIVSGATVALASLFNTAAAGILRGAQSLNLLDIPPVSALALLLLNLRAQAYTVGLVFFALTSLLAGFLIFWHEGARLSPRRPQTSTTRRS